MGSGNSTIQSSGSSKGGVPTQGFWIRPGDDFIVVGERKGRTWAIQSSTSGTKDVRVSQVAGKGVKVSAHRVQYQPKCPDDKRDSPSSEVLYPTEASKVNYTNSVLLKSGVDSMHPKGDAVEWVSNDTNCLSRLERWSFIPNDPDYPKGAPLAPDTNVNIRVYNIGSQKQRALHTPTSDDSTTDLEIQDKLSSWKLYRTKGWVRENGQCKPWSIAADNVRPSDNPAYFCYDPKLEDGVWKVDCFTTGGQNKLYSTEAECQADTSSNGGNGGGNGGNSGGNGGGNGGDGGDNGGDGGGNGGNGGGNGGNGGGGEPKKPDEEDNTVVWVVGGVVAFIIVVALLAMLSSRQSR